MSWMFFCGKRNESNFFGVVRGFEGSLEDCLEGLWFNWIFLGYYRSIVFFILGFFCWWMFLGCLVVRVDCFYFREMGGFWNYRYRGKIFKRKYKEERLAYIYKVTSFIVYFCCIFFKVLISV